MSKKQCELFLQLLNEYLKDAKKEQKNIQNKSDLYLLEGRTVIDLKVKQIESIIKAYKHSHNG